MRRFGKVAAALIATMCTMFAGVATANADFTGGVDVPSEDFSKYTYMDNPFTLSNVKVSDVGTHTANVSFDYTIDSSQADKIKGICFSIWVQRITDITPIEKGVIPNMGEGTGYYVDCQHDGIVSDNFGSIHI